MGCQLGKLSYTGSGVTPFQALYCLYLSLLHDKYRVVMVYPRDKMLTGKRMISQQCRDLLQNNLMVISDEKRWVYTDEGLHFSGIYAVWFYEKCNYQVTYNEQIAYGATLEDAIVAVLCDKINFVNEYINGHIDEPISAQLYIGTQYKLTGQSYEVKFKMYPQYCVASLQ